MLAAVKPLRVAWYPSANLGPKPNPAPLITMSSTYFLMVIPGGSLLPPFFSRKQCRKSTASPHPGGKPFRDRKDLLSAPPTSTLRAA
eukprot:5800252-Amphidinium_carterae.1